MTHPTIESIRETRRKIAREHDYDVDRLFDFYQQREREEEEAQHAGALGELRALIGHLAEREQEAQAEGMRELADALSEDRARLSGAVERLSRRQREPGTAGAK